MRGNMAQRKAYNIALSEIVDVSRNELSDKRLQTLLDGFNTFEQVLASKSDPIVLDASRKPYDIIEGRHRIYLAREKGYTSVPCQLSRTHSVVEQFLIRLAKKEIYDRHNETPDFANEAEKIAIANSMFNGHVSFWITDLKVFPQGDKRVCTYQLHCTLDADARDDLSLLGVGLHGFVI
jgi:hypothetical protein